MGQHALAFERGRVRDLDPTYADGVTSAPPALELLVIAGCPNVEPAARLLREVLTEVGLADLDIPVEVITDQAGAQARGFVGSPTVLVAGVDPFAVPGAPPALACRVFRTPDGRLTGLPDRTALKAAITAHLLDDDQPRDASRAPNHP